MPALSQDDTLLQSIQLEAQYACFNRRRSLRTRDEGQPSVQETAGLIQIMDPSDPNNSYVNRLILAARVPDPLLLDAIRNYDTHNLKLSIDVMPHTLHAGLASRLIALGFVPALELMFLQRLSAVPKPIPPAAEVDIRKMGQGEGRLFMEAVAASLGTVIDPGLMASKQHFYEDPSFACYLAYVDHELAGLATLYRAGDRAWLANAYTFERFRGRGIQTALIQRRMQDAAQVGIRQLLTDVEFLSPSFRNLQRLGFQVHYSATNWERIPG